MAPPTTSACHELRRYVERRDGNEYAWVGESSMAKSLECGCEYCELACELAEKVEIKENKERNKNASAMNAELTFQKEAGVEIDPNQVLYPKVRDSGIGFGMERNVNLNEMFVLDRADDPIIPVAPSLSGYTGSDQALCTVRKWFEECVKEHKMLCPPVATAGKPPKLPLRVIDVGLSGSQEARLIETRDEEGFWACLSHCWGGEHPLETRRDTGSLAQHLVSIKWEKLPKTFQEAIDVTRRFRIQYLWIDSLCIIQDDLKDWETQSAQMAYIYEHCVLTFAGSASLGPHQGLFRHTDPEHLDRPIVKTLGYARLDKIRIRKALVHDMAELPLLHRCWVHQERLLSPRYLHFGRNELLWECRECMKCECGGFGQGHQSVLPTWPAPKDHLHPGTLRLGDWMLHRGASAWHAVVMDYSRMNLTKAQDIFPAISGLAKSVRDATGWEYVAGLWRENIIVDLIWYAGKPNVTSRCESWRAPTFSWASVTSTSGTTGGGWVTYRYVDALRQGLARRDKWETYFYATFVEAEYTPHGDDPTGRLKSASIVLKGTLIKTTLCRIPSHYRTWHIAAIGKEPEDRDDFYEDFNLAEDELQGSKEGDEVFCLKLVGSKKNVKYADHEFVAWLVLKKVQITTESASKGAGQTFERIGLLASSKDEVHLDEESEVSAIERDVLASVQ